MIRTLDIARDARAPLVARQALDDVASDFDRTTLQDARLLLTELVTNSVRHGEGEGVRVILDRPDDGTLRCEVVDDGHGFLPIARPRRGDEIGGWGLHLVEQVASSWGVREGSTHVWFEIEPRRRA
jgi:anti-sigma regulatory factor (Ser/Thr protein kinase)